MNRNNNDQIKENIILFPGLKDRLVQMGMESMETNNFEKAADFFLEAKAIDSADPQVGMALVVALYESAQYKEAKRYASELLSEGIGDYYDVMDLYLLILIQLNQHEQVINTLEVLFEERHVPLKKSEHFHAILQLSKKMVGDKEAEIVEEQEVFTFNENNLHEQMLKLAAIADKNVQPYLDDLIRMLADRNSHPFLQTIVLNVLKEHKIGKEVEVKKISLEGRFIPANLPDVTDMKFQRAILSELEQELEHINPVLFVQLKEMIERHFFLIYPFEPEPPNPRALGRNLSTLRA